MSIHTPLSCCSLASSARLPPSAFAHADRRKVAKRGIEARLYAPMVAGVTLAIGCFWYGFSSTPSVHWIVPCIGLVIVIASILTIYITAFVYLSECYGSYASSAIAAQSFARNMIGGSFSFFTIDVSGSQRSSLSICNPSCCLSARLHLSPLLPSSSPPTGPSQILIPIPSSHATRPRIFDVERCQSSHGIDADSLLDRCTKISPPAGQSS